MPRRGGRQNGRINDEVDSQPLLVSSREDLSTRSSPSSSQSPSASSSTDNVLFAIDDDNDELETSALADTPRAQRTPKADQSVRFQDQVQVIAPSLRSTLESREAGTSPPVRGWLLTRWIHTRDFSPLEYDLDSDVLDDDAVAQASLEHGLRRGDPRREQTMPLLVGLLDASAVRRSLDIPMGVDGAPTYSDVDLDELAAKQSRVGGMLNSIANMSNSILGAGA
jgi:solute carrier family 38 (sodium-coupled neutral amino acid transporter), member 11